MPLRRFEQIDRLGPAQAAAGASLDRGCDTWVHVSISDIGQAEGISKNYVSRILRLALLAPAIVEAILAGRTDQELMVQQLQRPLPASWQEQHEAIGQTRRSSPSWMAGSSPQIGGQNLFDRARCEVELGE